MFRPKRLALAVTFQKDTKTSDSSLYPPQVNAMDPNKKSKPQFFKK